MSVTIVSTLPKPAQVTATDNTTSANVDTAAASLNFASLLFGQLLPVTTDKTIEKTLETKGSETDTTPVDASTLLAALGILPTDVKPVSDAATVKAPDLPAVGKSDKTISAKLTALQTLSSQASQKASPGTTATEPASVVSPETNDKPAIFAVVPPVFPTVESILPKNTTADTHENTTIAMVATPNGNLNALAALHDAPVSIPTPIRDQNWTNDFSQKVVWMATSDKQSAQITLNPPQMGPIEVSLTMDKSNATASFVSANAEVRDAIETALPRLREMFASAGIELGQTNVSSQSFQQQADNGEGKSGTPQRTNDNAILVTNSDRSMPIRAFASQQGNGLVNTFA